MAQLLSRDSFRESVFKRDNFKCVYCGAPAKDAHHIMERRLFPDGGYYLNNGASVCEEHHILCEQTVISTSEIREKTGITEVVLPPHLYSDQEYDKWGNPILPNGQRLKGDLFFNESVQKILAAGGVLSLFTDKVKYPRTYHLPWSEGMNSDDRMLSSLTGLEGEEVIVTEKRDGENTTLGSYYYHARSIDSGHHPSRSYVKQLWAQVCGDIPEGWRVCGENLYATHSIHYKDLLSYFEAFSVWNDKNYCLSWDETSEWINLLGLNQVPTLYRGVFDEKKIKDLWSKSRSSTTEGYVVRVTAGFPYSEFRCKVGKFVRKNHVQTTKHWMRGQPIIPNELVSNVKPFFSRT